jgi:hypothetical protein
MAVHYQRSSTSRSAAGLTRAVGSLRTTPKPNACQPCSWSGLPARGVRRESNPLCYLPGREGFTVNLSYTIHGTRPADTLEISFEVTSLSDFQHEQLACDPCHGYARTSLISIQNACHYSLFWLTSVQGEPHQTHRHALPHASAPGGYMPDYQRHSCQDDQSYHGTLYLSNGILISPPSGADAPSLRP